MDRRRLSLSAAVALTLLLGGAELASAQTCFGMTPTITGAGKIKGTPGDDVIMGSDASDNIDGGGGSDTICGLGGDDRIKAGNGSRPPRKAAPPPRSTAETATT